MIAFPQPDPQSQSNSPQATPPWHAGFLATMPTIKRHASLAFRDMDSESRQELVQEVVCNALVAYKRLFDQGRVELAYPTVLARFGICQAADGRRVGTKRNVRDVLSEYAQRQKGFHVDRLDRFDREEGQWLEILVEDRRAGPARRPDAPGALLGRQYLGHVVGWRCPAVGSLRAHSGVAAGFVSPVARMSCGEPARVAHGAPRRRSHDLCRAARRTYLFAPLDPASAIETSHDALRIASPPAAGVLHGCRVGP